MKNYIFTEKFNTKQGDLIDFIYSGEVDAQLSDVDSGWKTYEMLAVINDEVVGNINITNINDEDFEVMAKKALGNSETLGRFKELNKDDIINILKISK